MAEPVDTGEEALEELVDTPTSKQLHAWVKERVGADNAAKGTYLQQPGEAQCGLS